MRRFYCTALFAAVVALVGCTSVPSAATRTQHITDTATQQGWQAHLIEGEQFNLLAFLPPAQSPQPLLTIYIEGDGLAWKNRSEPSDNPTPTNATALALALQHPGAVYLSRPCQSITGPLCEPALWTSGRFSEAVINASNQAIDSLKARYQADTLQLIGYSGGGAVAALVAARRDDVRQLVTVAGNLDHRRWTELHDVSALSQSLNPADIRQSLQSTSQYHLVGQNDTIVPPQLVQNFIAAFSPSAAVTLRIIDGFDHHCCWQQQWPALLMQIDRQKLSQ
ncbi:MAG: hypothetical protein ACI9WS_001115 [Paraglaciecola psychrophila]